MMGDNDPELCFGMVCMCTSFWLSTPITPRQLRDATIVGSEARLQQLTSKLFGDKKPDYLDVSLVCVRTMLCIQYQKGGYIGILDIHTSSGLKTLLGQFSSLGVRLQLFIPLLQDDSEGCDSPRTSGIRLFINIYGPRSLFNRIGKLLSDSELFLQRPQHNYYGINYENPHYFIPPSDRRDLNNSSVSRTRNMAKIEDEVSAIFDTATLDLPTFEVGLGSGITTTLKKCVQFTYRLQVPRLMLRPSRHQKQGLHFMLQRESVQTAGDSNINLAHKLTRGHLVGLP